MKAEDLVAILNQLRPLLEERDRQIAQLQARVETLEVTVTEMRRQRGGVASIAAGQPKPNERGRI